MVLMIGTLTLVTLILRTVLSFLIMVVSTLSLYPVSLCLIKCLV